MRLTFGRYPTRYEMEEYYTREDILEYIYDASSVRKVILSFKDEPSIYSEGQATPINVENTNELRDYLRQRFSQFLPDSFYPYDKPLSAYPSFHFITKGNEGESWDFIMEADCLGWRKSFVDIRGVVEILHDYELPFLMKFSGHRSLHLIIPREAFPEEFDGKPIGEVWKKLEGSLRAFFAKKALVNRAHGTGGILRLPYSLNENFGMVSVPIHYEELDAFRPWESFHHLVYVKEKFVDFIQRCKENSYKTEQFLQDALNSNIQPLPHKIWSFSIVQKPQYIETEGIGRPAEVWQYLPLMKKPDNDIIQNYKEESPDVRWFIAELLINDERAFELFPESDEYARCAIEDSIALQAHKSMTAFFDRIQRLGDRNLIRWMRSILERLDFGLLEKELIRRCESSNESESMQIIGWASIVSSVFDNWQFSETISQKIMGRFPDLLSEIDRKIITVTRDLETWEEDKIREAQRILIEAGDQAVDHVILLLASNKSWVRQRVMGVILKLKNPAFIECLIESMGDENRKVRSMATSALIGFGDIAKPFVEEAANVDNPVVRANAIGILSIIEGKGSIDIAMNGLKSTNLKIRNASIKSLRKMDDERSYEALRLTLWDISPNIGVNAAVALSNFGEKGIEVLKDAMVQAKDEGSENVLRCIAYGLAEASDASGIEYLISALNDDSWSVWGTHLAILNLKKPHGNDALLDYLRINLLEKDFVSSPDVRSTIAILGKIEDDRAMPLIKSAIAKQKDKKILRDLIRSLSVRAAELKDKESALILIDLVKNNNHHINQIAANELMKIGGNWLPEIKKAFEEAEKNLGQYNLLKKVIQQYSE